MSVVRSIDGSGSRARLRLHRLGTLLGLAGVAFVAQRLFAYQAELTLGAFGGGALLASFLLSLAYAGAGVCLVLGWHALLSFLAAPQKLAWTLRTYAVTQLARYLPGNVFQYAGRQAAGAAAGIPHGVLIRSAVLELALISLAAACFAPLIAPSLLPAIPAGWAIVLFALAVSGFGAVLILRAPRDIRRAATAYACHVVASGLVFLGVFRLAGGDVPGWSDALTIVAAFAVAWLAGLLTPGAPAGLGVREAVLVVVLAGLAPAPIVLTAALLGRVVTVLGDLIFFLAGMAIPATANDAGPGRRAS